MAPPAVRRAAACPAGRRPSSGPHRAVRPAAALDGARWHPRARRGPDTRPRDPLTLVGKAAGERDERPALEHRTDRRQAAHSPADGSPADRCPAECGTVDRCPVADGYVFAPHIVPEGLDTFVAKVVPLLRERGVFRTAYTADTLRGDPGLGPARTPS